MGVHTREQLLTVRSSVALSRLEHVHYIRISGDGAYDAMDRVFPRELYLRDGQLSQGLLLDDEARVFADCYLGSDEDEFFLLAEGPGASELVEYLRRHSSEIDDVEIADAGETHAIVGLDGPYAWELMARLVGQEVIGLPYLTFFHFDHFMCYRAGKTGEYGYGLVVAREELEAVWEKVAELGRSLDVREVGLDVLDCCALENWFFNVRAEGRRAVTPLELQLQWRVSRQKEYVGSEALTRRRAKGIRQRLTYVLSDEPMNVDDTVHCDGEPIGEIVNADFSPIREDWVGLALLDIEYAFPGIATLRIGTESTPARTVSPPVINNRSLYVNPQVHSYVSREEDGFAPLVEP